MIETAKEVRWIQLSLDVFNNKKIRAIEKMPDGDTLIVIWFKLLVLAGQINDNGCVYFTRDIPFTDQLLSVEFDRPISTVQLALCTFQKFGMINIVDDLILVSNWTKYQNEKWLEEARKEKDRERQKRWYDRKKALTANGGSENLTLGNALEQRENNVEPFFLSSDISSSQSLIEDKDKGCGEKGKKRSDSAEQKEEKELIARFEIFWDAYGKKDGRKDALRSFRKINPDEELFKKIIEGVERYHRTRKWLGGYRMMGATWLNGEHWNDANEDVSMPNSTQLNQQKPLYKPDGTYDYESGESEEWPSL